jgi:spermidine/putrescine transport system permease protein
MINKIKNIRKAPLIAVLPMYIFTLVFVLGPLVYMIWLSFAEREGERGLSGALTLDNYLRIFEPVYLQTFGTSLQLALITTILCVAIGYPFGYMMARLDKKWRNLALVLMIIPFWTSSLMRLYGWITVFRANGPLDKALMWMHLTDEPLKLLYTYPAVVAGMVYSLLPFMIYAVFASAEKLNIKLTEASRDLGANGLTSFLTVGLPLTLPGLFSGVILTFVPSMGLYFIADLLGGGKTVLVGTEIQEQVNKVHNLPFAAALSVVLLVVTAAFLFLYRKITGVDDLEGIV